MTSQDNPPTPPTPNTMQHLAESRAAAPEASRPVDGVPLSPESHALLVAGIEDAKAGRVKDLGSFAQYASPDEASTAPARASAEMYIDAVESENARLRSSWFQDDELDELYERIAALLPPGPAVHPIPGTTGGTHHVSTDETEMEPGLYPFPTIRRLRVIQDSSNMYFRVWDNNIQWRHSEIHEWGGVDDIVVNTERIHLWHHLLTNPFEEVEDDGLLT